MAVSPSLDMAADFFARAGPGINIMASNIRFGQLDSGDWDGLASRVGHVRLCGDVAAVLTNFSTCPATRWQPRPRGDPIAEARALMTADPAFALFKRAATEALSSGLSVVLDPLHVGFGLVLDAELLAAFWGAVLLEFDEVAFPPASVAFEMANEPGNAWGRHRVRGRLSSMYRGWVEQVRRAQPSRVLILPGELGVRCDGLGGGHSLSSSAALAADAAQLSSLAQADGLIAVTFHYYEPRAFTTQSDAASVRWHAASQAAAVAADMASLRQAIGPTTPVYLGEFGLAAASIAQEEEAAAWLRAVREAAEAAHMAWALWTYFTSRQGLVEGHSAEERMQAFDCSALLSAVYTTDDGVYRGAHCSHARRQLQLSEAAASSSTLNGSWQVRQPAVLPPAAHRRRASPSECNDHRPAFAPQATVDVDLGDLCAAVPPPSPPPVPPTVPAPPAVPALGRPPHAHPSTALPHAACSPPLPPSPPTPLASLTATPAASLPREGQHAFALGAFALGALVLGVALGAAFALALGRACRHAYGRPPPPGAAAVAGSGVSSRCAAELDAMPGDATPGDATPGGATPGVVASDPEAGEVATKPGLWGLLLRVRRYAMLPEERMVEEAEAPPEGDAKREAREARAERPQARFGRRRSDGLDEEVEMVPPAPLGQRVIGGARPETREGTSATASGCGQRVEGKGRSYELD